MCRIEVYLIISHVHKLFIRIKVGILYINPFILTECVEAVKTSFCKTV